jgi:hypothetical protein
MLLDETCFFLAIDFDEQNWTEAAQTFLETCGRMNVPAALDRSRSGRGGHVWCFFAEPIPAALTRRLGSYVLTESMGRRPDIGFQSYDRFGFTIRDERCQSDPVDVGFYRKLRSDQHRAATISRPTASNRWPVGRRRDSCSDSPRP